MVGPAFQIADSAVLCAALSACETLLVTTNGDTADKWVPGRLAVDEWKRESPKPRNISVFAELEKLQEYDASFTIQGNGPGGLHFRGTAGFRKAAVSTGIVADSAPVSLFSVTRAPSALSLGTKQTVLLEFYSACAVTLEPPFGKGLRVRTALQFDVSPGVHEFEIIADRPHEVNLGKPWPFWIRAQSGDRRQEVELSIRVPDPQPGRIFYILTEDCETFDGGPLTGNYGDARVMGNHNNFMDPEDYLIQMVAKPVKMNEIAEKHGAHWTHFWAVHQRFGAAWAIAHSATGRWNDVVQALDRSIRDGSAGHEYAPHLHCDYEPDCTLPPQPRLIYDASTDGILPNDYYDPISNPTHRYHDWDGAARGGPGIKELGHWDKLDSKTGSLFKGLHHLAQLQAQHRQTLVARTGSFDFGANPQDQEISTQAYERVGLRANSDARFTAGDPIPGGHLFWCERDDRFQRISDLRNAHLVQLAVTRDVSFHLLEDVNGWFMQHWPTCRGAGVHGLVLMTHAMFMRGAPDPFRSVEGGAFDVLDRHLAWVRKTYPDIEFATASEAVTEFLDYYTPNVLGIADPRLIGGDPGSGRFEFSVRLLGRGILVGPECPASISIQAPSSFLPSDILSLEVRQGAAVLAHTESNTIDVSLMNRDLPVLLEVKVREHAIEKMSNAFQPKHTAQPFHDAPEHRRSDLLHLRLPVDNRYPIDTLRLLTNPIAGENPTGKFNALWPAALVAGASLHEAGKLKGDSARSFQVLFAVDQFDQDFVVSAQGLDGVIETIAIDDGGRVLASAMIRYVDKDKNDASGRWKFWSSKISSRLRRFDVLRKAQ